MYLSLILDKKEIIVLEFLKKHPRSTNHEIYDEIVRELGSTQFFPEGFMMNFEQKALVNLVNRDPLTYSISKHGKELLSQHDKEVWKKRILWFSSSIIPIIALSIALFSLWFNYD